MRVDERDGLEHCYTNLKTPNLTAKPRLHKKKNRRRKGRGGRKSDKSDVSMHSSSRLCTTADKLVCAHLDLLLLIFLMGILKMGATCVKRRLSEPLMVFLA